MKKNDEYKELMADTATAAAMAEDMLSWLLGHKETRGCELMVVAMAVELLLLCVSEEDRTDYDLMSSDFRELIGDAHKAIASHRDELLASDDDYPLSLSERIKLN